MPANRVREHNNNVTRAISENEEKINKKTIKKQINYLVPWYLVPGYEIKNTTNDARKIGKAERKTYVPKEGGAVAAARTKQHEGEEYTGL